MRGFVDHAIQAVTRLLPSHLPRRVRQWRDLYEHHLLVRVSNDQVKATRTFLPKHFAPAHMAGGWFECDAEEGRKAFLHRFAIAGAAIRYREVHRREVEDIVALDIAPRRNDREWVEQLPQDVERDVVHKLYYGHFFCQRVPPGLHREEGREPAGRWSTACGSCWTRAAPNTPAEQQRGPPLRGQARAGGLLPIAAPNQHLQPRHRPPARAQLARVQPRQRRLAQGVFRERLSARSPAMVHRLAAGPAGGAGCLMAFFTSLRSTASRKSTPVVGQLQQVEQHIGHLFTHALSARVGGELLRFLRREPLEQLLQLGRLHHQRHGQVLGVGTAAIAGQRQRRAGAAAGRSHPASCALLGCADHIAQRKRY